MRPVSVAGRSWRRASPWPGAGSRSRWRRAVAGPRPRARPGRCPWWTWPRARASTHPSVYGGVDRKRFIIETNGAGVALLDYDDDGWLDALVLSGTRLAEGARADAAWPRGPGAHQPALPQPARRHVRGRDGRARACGARRWSSSVCAGDYDNDGVAGPVPHRLRHERPLSQPRGPLRGRDRGRRPAHAPGRAGARGARSSTTTATARLDLFVANYLTFDLAAAAEPGQGTNCLWKGIPVNCGPKGLATDTNLLFHNEGDGRFRDVSEASGDRARHRPLCHDGHRRRLRRRRLGRHLRRLRLDGVDPLSQRPRRHVQGRGRRERRRLQRDGQRAGRDGSRPRRLRFRRPARPAQDALRRRHARLVPRARPRAVRGCGDGGRPRPAEPLRASGAPGCPISTTTAGRTSSTSPATCTRRSSGCCRSTRIAGPRVVFRNRGAGAFEEATRRSGPGSADGALQPRRRLRRRGQRRRRGRARHEHERAALAAAQRLRGAELAGSRCGSRGRGRTAPAWARRWWSPRAAAARRRRCSARRATTRTTTCGCTSGWVRRARRSHRGALAERRGRRPAGRARAPGGDGARRVVAPRRRRRR